MQDTFIKFIIEAKERGKTILLSSHMFSEVDATCDRISIIKEGRLVSTFIADDLRHSENKEWKIEFQSSEDFERFHEQAILPEKFKIASTKKHRNQVKVVVNDHDINALVVELSNYSLKFFTEIKFTLEDYFMKFYDRNAQPEGETVNAKH
jgi:ABC-2 type transport system ATP-binding protein